MDPWKIFWTTGNLAPRVYGPLKILADESPDAQVLEHRGRVSPMTGRSGNMLAGRIDNRLNSVDYDCTKDRCTWHGIINSCSVVGVLL